MSLQLLLLLLLLILLLLLLLLSLLLRLLLLMQVMMSVLLLLFLLLMLPLLLLMLLLLLVLLLLLLPPLLPRLARPRPPSLPHPFLIFPTPRGKIRLLRIPPPPCSPPGVMHCRVSRGAFKSPRTPSPIPAGPVLHVSPSSGGSVLGGVILLRTPFPRG